MYKLNLESLSQRGMSLMDLHNQSGVSYDTLETMTEKGVLYLRQSTEEKICKSLSCSRDDIFIYYPAKGGEVTSLKNKMDTAGITLAELSSKTGISEATLRCYWSGTRDINKASVLTVYKIASVLGVSMEDIININE